ncbi:quinone-dependent dihydroorotate dehydrogenase [Phyllobacterium zundukense]|uniref:Dihydroorotate dehydrogenase (quinone) n=1 Tax=Phyllobacterium zundukense TaxID=1867719 RepID=A0A2N9VS91_9HYPH|nr:quinone-dependent dihydroorotate dehydrogenase [Phyllobacterium zundukense]ATU92781.1 dihydroorotate dehydrogenase (quinone) [Phyllobacterium zundukense]PIO42359.1 dihydroorotate dehydrogenase (quinone) [Phyllobacterium zundukense]
MSGLFQSIGRKVLFSFDPEDAHGLSIKALKTGLVPACTPQNDPALRVTVAGLSFPNPLGMAAGYDKNAEVPDALLNLGFGFAEVGTLTPLAQSGNPKPRIFRLVEDNAVINRLGFNNEGHEPAFRRLTHRRSHAGIVGVNIGANKDSTDRVADYVAGIRKFHSLASYFTVNISSPNTPGLRDLQARDSLKELLGKVLEAREVQAGVRRPVFLKIAPDLHEANLDEIAAEIALHPLDGLIISNTTLSRSGLKSTRNTNEAGGLSGVPLFERSTIVLAKMRQRVGPELPLIGVGGIDSAAAAITKIRAGADLVQLYTSMIYRGPGLAGEIVKGLSAALKRDGVTTIAALRDCDMASWAGRAIPA